MGFGAPGPRLGDGAEEGEEVLAVGDREAVEGVRDDVGAAAAGQVELDGHAVRARLRGPVGHVGDARAVREPDGRPTALPWRCGAFDSVAAAPTGVNSPSQTIPLACAAEARVLAEERVHRVHDLLGDAPSPRPPGGPCPARRPRPRRHRLQRVTPPQSTGTSHQRPPSSCHRLRRPGERAIGVVMAIDAILTGGASRPRRRAMEWKNMAGPLTAWLADGTAPG